MGSQRVRHAWATELKSSFLAFVALDFYNTPVREVVGVFLLHHFTDEEAVAQTGRGPFARDYSFRGL